MCSRFYELGRKCSIAKRKMGGGWAKGRKGSLRKGKMETEGRDGREGRRGEDLSVEICHVPAHTAYNEWNHYVYLKCANKLETSKKS